MKIYSKYDFIEECSSFASKSLNKMLTKKLIMFPFGIKEIVSKRRPSRVFHKAAIMSKSIEDFRLSLFKVRRLLPCGK